MQCGGDFVEYLVMASDRDQFSVVFAAENARAGVLK
jgi:hypothetical protein